jgi:hypothetical protein
MDPALVVQLVEIGATLVQRMIGELAQAPNREAAEAVVARFRAISQGDLDADRAKADQILQERNASGVIPK